MNNLHGRKVIAELSQDDVDFILNSDNFNDVKVLIAKRNKESVYRMRDKIEADIQFGIRVFQTFESLTPELGWDTIAQDAAEDESIWLDLCRIYREAEDNCFENHESFDQLNDYLKQSIEEWWENA